MHFKRTQIAFLSFLFCANATAVDGVEDMPSFGGDGPLYRVEKVVCPAQHFLVGLVGRSGAWIDSIKLICAPRTTPAGHANPQLGNRFVGGQFGTSTGGVEGNFPCNGVKGAITVIDFNTVREGEDRVINKIRATCRNIDNQNFAGGFLIGHDDAGSGNLQSHCPVPKYAIGVVGKIHPYGYPGRIGLVCAPRDY